MIDREKVAEQALALSATDREYLRDVLDQSLAPDPVEHVRNAADWSAEIDRRIDEVNRGEVRTISAEEMLQAIERELDEQRARTSQ